MRFVVVLAVLVSWVGAARVRAQDDPPALLDTAPAAAGGVDDSTAIETAPSDPAPPDAPAPIDPAPTPPTTTPSTSAPAAPQAEGGCGAWPLFISGAVFEGASAGVGSALVLVGGLMATIDPTPTGANCVQACVNALFAILIIAIGVSIAAAGLLALGPIAAIGVTVSAALLSAGASRKVWPAIVGGSVGIVTSAAGAGLLVWAFFNAAAVPFIARAPLDLSDGTHVAFVSGLALSATGGLVSLATAVGLDAAFGGPSDEASARDQAETAPLARGPAARPATRHAMAF